MWVFFIKMMRYQGFHAQISHKILCVISLVISQLICINNLSQYIHKWSTLKTMYYKIWEDDNRWEQNINSLCYIDWWMKIATLSNYTNSWHRLTSICYKNKITDQKPKRYIGMFRNYHNPQSCSETNAGFVVNYGISNTAVLEIPQFTINPAI